MSTTTQAPQHLDPAASLHPETLGRAPGRHRLTGRHIIVVGAGQRKVVDEKPPVGNGRAMAILFAREEPASPASMPRGTPRRKPAC